MNKNKWVYLSWLHYVCSITMAMMAVVVLSSCTQDKGAESALVSVVTLDKEKTFSDIKENDSRFNCPVNEVMTGRGHKGDENGKTTYFCKTAYLNPTKTLDLTATVWSAVIKESDGVEYTCPQNKVLISRRHGGDENGGTVYQCASIQGAEAGSVVVVENKTWSQEYTESDYTLKCGANQVMTGRYHKGDENGKTKHQCATLRAP